MKRNGEKKRTRKPEPTPEQLAQEAIDRAKAIERTQKDLDDLISKLPRGQRTCILFIDSCLLKIPPERTFEVSEYFYSFYMSEEIVRVRDYHVVQHCFKLIENAPCKRGQIILWAIMTKDKTFIEAVKALNKPPALKIAIDHKAPPATKIITKNSVSLWLINIYPKNPPFLDLMITSLKEFLGYQWPQS